MSTTIRITDNRCLFIFFPEYQLLQMKISENCWWLLGQVHLLLHLHLLSHQVTAAQAFQVASTLIVPAGGNGNEKKCGVLNFLWLKTSQLSFKVLIAFLFNFWVRMMGKEVDYCWLLNSLTWVLSWVPGTWYVDLLWMH